MNDPLERATATAPPILGEGCTQRYDPQSLKPEDGTEFADAAELWRQLQQPKEMQHSEELPLVTDKQK